MRDYVDDLLVPEDRGATSRPVRLQHHTPLNICAAYLHRHIGRPDRNYDKSIKNKF